MTTSNEIPGLPFEVVVCDGIPLGEVFIGRPDAIPPERLMRGSSLGALTIGGLAEAGWLLFGRIGPDGIQQSPIQKLYEG